jgi:methionyl-tRNA formyltransferase
MNVSILCTDPNHPVVDKLKGWVNDAVSKGHDAQLAFDKSELSGGDVLYLVSCSQIISEVERTNYKSVLVLHASDLPQGRGWSPYIWSILDGRNQVTVSLLEASDPVDSGSIWLKTEFFLEGHELLPEINEKLFDAELLLMSQALDQFDRIIPKPQLGEPGPYMKRRTPADSRLDPNKTIAEQFNLLRVVDSTRYPAFFEYQGQQYLVKIEKVKNE